MTTPPPLHAALRAHACGLYPAEAGVELLLSHGSFLHRSDFHDRFVRYATDSTTPMADIDWQAAITALNTGHLPCSGGEQRMLRIAASLTRGIPVDLHDCLTGLDHNNIQLVVTSVLHASGQHPKLHDHF